MTHQQLLSLFDEVVTEARAVMASKNQDYANNGDCLANMREAARDLEMSPEKVWWVYMDKQLRAIKARVNGRSLKSESLRSRVVDCINFLVLLEALSEPVDKPEYDPREAECHDWPYPDKEVYPEDLARAAMADRFGLSTNPYITSEHRRNVSLRCRAAGRGTEGKAPQGCPCGRCDPAT